MAGGWAAALQGIGAAGQGALEGYSWQKDQQRQDRRMDQDDEAIALRRKQLLAEIQRMTDQVKAGEQQAKYEANTEQAEEAERQQYIDSLPKHLQPVARGKQHGFSFDADDFQPLEQPETPEEAAAREAAELERLEAESAARARGTRRGNPPRPQAPRAPVSEPTVQIRTVDDQGNEVLKVVPRSQAAGTYRVPQRSGEDGDPLYDSPSPGQPPVTPAGGGQAGASGPGLWDRFTGAVGSAISGASEHIPRTPEESLAGQGEPADDEGFGDPEIDEQVRQLIDQFHQSNDADERAAIQHRLQQLTGGQ